MKYLINISLAILLSVAIISPASAQTAKQIKQAKKEAVIKQLIESQNFVFQANFMYPMGGGQRFLNAGNYDLAIGKDTVVAFLPYFGVAFSGAGYNNTEDNGINFTSTRFDYKNQAKNNDSWIITIKPQDTRTTNQMILTVFKNGLADLSVISQNRQRIRFDGIITEKPKTKK